LHRYQHLFSNQYLTFNTFLMKKIFTLLLLTLPFVFELQAQCTNWSISPTSNTVPAGGGSGTFTVGAAGNNCGYYTTYSPFISVQDNTGYVSYSVGQNTGIASYGFIWVKDAATGQTVQTFQLNQDGASGGGTSSCTNWYTSPSSNTISSTGGSGHFDIHNNTGLCFANYRNLPNWISLTNAAAGGYDYTVTVTNPSNSNRTATIEIIDNVTGFYQTEFQLTQLGSTGGGGTNYTITANASPTAGGSVIGGASYALGTTANLSASAYSGYQFSGWNKDGNPYSSSPSISYVVDGDHTFTAIFMATGGGGTGNCSSCTVSLDYQNLWCDMKL
jgi:Divergent InlB B-repeat domain